ncbi:MAG: HAD family hydrolase [Desulfobacteraceae bacterium]
MIVGKSREKQSCWKREAGVGCPKLFVTDFDGTLLRSDRTFSTGDLDALEHLGQRGVTRVVATGRSLYSFMQSAGADLPVDYTVFSTGAGTAAHPTGKIVRKTNLAPAAVDRALRVFVELDFDFMVHHPVPDNHWFSYRRTQRHNPDFETRVSGYEKFAVPLALEEGTPFGPAAQLLAVVPRDQAAAAVDLVQSLLPDFSVIPATSPMDGHSTWLELFDPGVSKSQTVAWLAAGLGITPAQTMAIGNDFNDLDLLEWAGSSFVVDNAPDQLKRRFNTVASNNSCGVARAVDLWLAEIPVPN